MEEHASINAKYAHAETFARSQNLLADNESFSDAFERIARVLIHETEGQLGTPVERIQRFYSDFIHAIVEGDISLGTPILINAGRVGREDKPLTSCVSPPRNVLEGTLRADRVASLYDTEMGMAVNLDYIYGNPKAVMEWLDEQARQAEDRGKKRACNMITMSVNHPDILKFIQAKVDADPRKSKSNISVMVDDRFMKAVEDDTDYNLDLKPANGECQSMRAREIFECIVNAAYKNGDPGIIFKDRWLEDDPTPHLSDRIAVAPCSELNLAPGEACQFSYINLGNMTTHGSEKHAVDWHKLEKLIHMMQRFLDNALEYSIARHTSEEAKKINAAKRKVGLGILGLADLLIELGIPYDSEEALKVIRDVMSFINYHSKRASMLLAQERGAFPAFQRSKYANDDGFLRRRLSNRYDFVISGDQWDELFADIRKYGLRNAATVAAPPTGRSSQLIPGATASVEPIWSCLVPAGDDISEGTFDVEMGDGTRKVRLNPRFKTMLEVAGVPLGGDIVNRIIESRGAISHIQGLPEDVRRLFLTTGEISTAGHINAVANVQPHIDEAVSKTVNLPNHATVEVVREIYMKAWKARLKGIAIFRDGCVGEKNQLKMVAKPTEAR